MAVLVAAVVVPAVWFGLSAAWADANSLRARWTIAEWRQGKGPAVTAAVWGQAREDLLASARIVPTNPQWYDDLGYLDASRAEALGRHPKGSVVWNYQQRLFGQAESSFQQSANLRPTFPYAWAYLALTKHLQDKHDAEFWAAYDKAYRFGNAEAGVQPLLARMALEQWAELSAERKGQISSMVASAQPAAAQVLQSMAARAKVQLP